MFPIIIPQKVQTILDTLREAGFEAYIVGGCVRDALLGRTPNDWDITTSALPETVRSLFRRTVDTGLKHGTVTVMLGSDHFEVTTYRSDGAYSDARHPDQVTFVTSLQEDLARRDFTINAMAYHPAEGLIDRFGGQADLASGVIRAVGVPADRFAEDALRMLRAVRFSAQLGFSIDQTTGEAIRFMAPRLSLVSHERIRDELDKLLLSPHPDYFERLSDYGITAVIFPRFDEMLATPQHSRFHIYDVGHHTLSVLTHTEPTLLMRLTALLHDTGKVECRRTDPDGFDHFKGHPEASAVFAEAFLRDYRYDNQTIRSVTHLIRVHDLRRRPTLPSVRRLIHEVGRDMFPQYMAFSVADNAAKSEFAAEEFWPRYRAVEAAAARILAAGDPIDIADLAVRGDDLTRAGITGRAVGLLLQTMLEHVWEEPSHNTKDYLLTHFLPEPAVASSSLP